MPPKGKGKYVHNTRSMSARSRSNSPLRVKVTNNLAKPKTKEHSKQPLKSVVKVVTSKQAKANNNNNNNNNSLFAGFFTTVKKKKKNYYCHP